MTTETSTTTDPKEANVATVLPIVAEMQARAELPNTLMGGTEAMRRAGTKYLPKMPLEEEQDYTDRLNASVLKPHFSETVDDFAAKPFEEPIAFGEGVPKQVQDWCKNVDLTGQDLTAFSRALLHKALVDGVTFVLVDHPKVPKGLSKAEEERIGARPYLAHVPLANLIYWRSSKVGDRQVLTHLRIRETVTVPKGEWGDEVIEQIRVIDPGMVRVFRYNAETKAWAMVTDLSGPVTLKEVAFVPIYTGRIGFMAATPPLEGLAHLNVAHWQSASDQRNILHVARVPFLFMKGIEAPKPGEQRPVGAHHGIFSPHPEADVKFVEHSGKAIEAGRQDLKDLEEAMRQISGELISTVRKTATESEIDSGQACSWLKAQVLGMEAALSEALRLMGAWKNLGGDYSVTIFKDFEVQAVDAPTLTALTGAAQSGLISHRTYLETLRDAGRMPSGFDVEAELQRLDDEASSLTGVAGS